MKKQSRIITRNQASSSHKKEAQIGGSSCGFRGVIMIAFKSICASLPHHCRWYLCKCCCCDGTRDEAPATTANRDFLECSLSLFASASGFAPLIYQPYNLLYYATEITGASAPSLALSVGSGAFFWVRVLCSFFHVRRREMLCPQSAGLRRWKFP